MAQTAKGFNTEIGNKIQYDNVTLKYSILYFSDINRLMNELYGKYILS